MSPHGNPSVLFRIRFDVNVRVFRRPAFVTEQTDGACDNALLRVLALCGLRVGVARQPK